MGLTFNNGRNAAAITSNSSLNVGIGTSSPTDSSGFGRIVDLNGSTGAAYYARYNSSATAYFLLGQDSSASYLYAKSTPLTMLVNNAERMRIDTSGNIGMGTASPSANLQLSGFGSGLPASSGSAQRGGFRIANSSNIGFDFGTVAAGQAWIQVSDVNNYASNFPLLLNPNGGNVGIGTSSPVAKLSIPTNTTNSQISTGSIEIQSYDVNNAWVADNLYYAGGFIARNTGYASQIYFQTDGSVAFKTSSSTTTAGSTVTSISERMRITSGGQVIIGSTSSLYTNVKLSVKQTAVNIPAEIWSAYSGDSGSGALMLIKYDNSSSSSQVFQRFVIDNGNTACGQINGNGASQVAFGSWSDSRLKENIENLPSQLSNILALRPVEFDYKNGSGHQIGFVAQEMKEIYPDAVGEDSDGFLTITGWSKTESRLVKAIQEMAAQIEELKSLINK
jgi:hypothetical protein